MDTGKVKIFKGLVHFGLALTPMLELKHATSKLRSTLLGIAAGWHLNAAYYHWFIEGMDDRNKRSKKSKRRNILL